VTERESTHLELLLSHPEILEWLELSETELRRLAKAVEQRDREDESSRGQEG
jgi:predicted Fe-S protein YdhL (DUF1289 family)